MADPYYYIHSVLVSYFLEYTMQSRNLSHKEDNKRITKHFAFFLLFSSKNDLITITSKYNLSDAIVIWEILNFHSPYQSNLSWQWPHKELKLDKIK